MNHVRMFKPQFAPLVESGAKCQTVRPIPKRMPKIGERISLREWTGKPYRSKQRVLREAEICDVCYCTVHVGGVLVDSIPQPADAFAFHDGFKSFEEMAAWFSEQHGLPFFGILIQWEAK